MAELPIIVVPEGIAKLHGMLCGCIDRAPVWKLLCEHLERDASEHKQSVEFTPQWYITESVLDHCGLTEHGIAIRYSWLTDKGRAALAFLLMHGDGWSEREDVEFLDDKECWLNPPSG